MKFPTNGTLNTENTRNVATDRTPMNTEEDVTVKELLDSIKTSLNANKKALDELAATHEREAQDEETGGLLNDPTYIREGLRFLEAVENRDKETVTEFIDVNFPVNFQHPETKLTALHIAASISWLKGIELLVNTKDCDYLLEDFLHRTPYDMAYYFGNSPELTEVLLEESLAQANRTNKNWHNQQMRKVATCSQEQWYGRLDKLANLKFLQTKVMEPQIS